MYRASVHSILCLACSVSVFSFASHASAFTYKVLYSFCHGGKFVCADGKTPSSNLVSDAAGNLYGTTTAGGDTGNGVIFELARNGGRYKYQVLHSFDGNAEGGVPATAMIIDTSGNLYGTTVSDGANFGGTAFELSPDAGHTQWTYTVLANFCFTDGPNCILGNVPESPLTYAGASSGQPYDGSSTLYGTTLEGGANGVGAAYSLTPFGGNWTGAVIYSFCSQANCADGQFPVGQLVLDERGTLYGTTNAGGTGANSSGVLYKIATATGAEAVVYNFCSVASCADGSGPLPGVTLARHNHLFGATAVGGKNGSGTVYEANVQTEKEHILYAFCRKTGCADGIGPTSPVVEVGGSLLGAAGGGGSGSNGVIYRIGVSNDESVLYSFCQQPDCVDGSTPLGVIAGSKGALFGVTQRGGKRNDGVVFELTP